MLNQSVELFTDLQNNLPTVVNYDESDVNLMVVPPVHEENYSQLALHNAVLSNGTFRLGAVFKLNVRNVVNDVANRWKSFPILWSKYFISPLSLSQAGFMYYNKNVVCVFCHIRLEKKFLSKRNVNPMELHRLLSMKCPFVCNIDIGNHSLTMTECHFLPKPCPLIFPERAVEIFPKSKNTIPYKDVKERLESFDSELPIKYKLSEEGFYQDKPSGSYICFSCECQKGNKEEEGHFNLRNFHNDSTHCAYWRTLETLDGLLDEAKDSLSDVVKIKSQHFIDVFSVPNEKDMEIVWNSKVVMMVISQIELEEVKYLRMALSKNVLKCSDFISEKLSEEQAMNRIFEAVKYLQFRATLLPFIT